MTRTENLTVDLSNLPAAHAAWDAYDANDVAPDESEAEYLAYLAA